MTSIIVDDEPLARKGIRLLCDQYGGICVLGAFSCPKETLAYLDQNRVDLVFLDIQMPGISGLTFAESVLGKTQVIFTTAYPQYATESYNLDATDYLLKPIRPERFAKAVQKAQLFHTLMQPPEKPEVVNTVSPDFLFVKADRKYFKIKLREVIYIAGLKDYLVLHLDGRQIITAMNIKTIHQQLPPAMFARVSKSHIINIHHIQSFDNTFIQLSKGVEIPIGTAYRATFFADHVQNSIIVR